MGLFTKNIGIDLGTSNTLVYTKGDGIIISEPSVVAIDKGTLRVLAVGEEANEMIGRTPDSIMAIRPLKDGVVADFDITQALLRKFIKIARGAGVFKPCVVICVPSGITEVEKRAVEEAAITAGAKEVVLLDEPIAAAIGAGINISDPTGAMIVDIGGGTTEIAVVCLGGVVASRSLRIAGDAMDASIINYVKKTFSLNIGDKMAEEVKIKIGSAYPGEADREYELRGRDVTSGLPRAVTITSSQVREAVEENLAEIMEAIKSTLERTPPELASDILENGITLSGGGALLYGIDKLIFDTLKIPAHIADNPLECACEGVGKSLDNIKQIIMWNKYDKN